MVLNIGKGIIVTIKKKITLWGLTFWALLNVGPLGIVRAPKRQPLCRYDDISLLAITTVGLAEHMAAF